MNDLIETYARAKFGKQAFLESLFGKRDPQKPSFLESIFGKSMDPQKRAMRDKVEDMIREEQRKRKLAQEAIAYGKYRLAEAPKSGLGGWATDIARSMVPGLSISASTVRDGLVKKAEEPAPESRWGGRLFDAAHLTAGAGGATAGYAVQKGLLGGVGASRRLVKELGSELTGPLAKSFRTGGSNASKILGELMTSDPTSVVLAGNPALRGTGRLSKLSPTYWMRRWAHKPTDARKARAYLSKELRKGGVDLKAIRGFFKKLPGMVDTARTGAVAKLTSSTAKRIPFAGKWRPIVGALAAMAPFAAIRLAKTRGLRARGGTAGQASVQKAEELLQGAEQLRKEREALTQQLG